MAQGESGARTPAHGGQAARTPKAARNENNSFHSFRAKRFWSAMCPRIAFLFWLFDIPSLLARLECGRCGFLSATDQHRWARILLNQEHRNPLSHFLIPFFLIHESESAKICAIELMGSAR